VWQRIDARNITHLDAIDVNEDGGAHASYFTHAGPSGY
jgi:hypothetical protein